MVPIFPTHQSDRKGVLNTGVWVGHRIWAFSSPCFVQKQPNNGHSTPPKNGHSFKMPIPRYFGRKVDTNRVLTSPHKSGCDQCGGFTMVALICSIWGGDVVVRWVNGKFSYERPGTLGSPLGYILLPPAAS